MSEVKLNEADLQKVVEESQDLSWRRCGEFLQVNCDMRTGEVWSNMLTGDDVVKYRDPDVVNCGRLYEETSVGELRFLIEQEVQCYADRLSNLSEEAPEMEMGM